MTFDTCADARRLARIDTSGEDDRQAGSGWLPSLVRIAVAVAVGMIVLLGWSTASAADTEAPAPAPATQAKPPVGLDLKPLTQLLTPLTESVGTTLETATAPVTAAVAPTVHATTETVRPAVDTVRGATKPLTPEVAPVVQTLEPVLQPVLAPVVAPVVDHVIAPVAEDVVAPLIAPTVTPVATPVAELIITSPTSPAADPDDDLIGLITDPIIDPITGLVTDPTTGLPTQPTDGSSALAGAAGAPTPDIAVSMAHATEAAQSGTAAVHSAPRASFDGITAPSINGTDDPGETIVASTAAAGVPGSEHAPADSSDLPEAPSPALPHGAPCGGASGAAGGSFLIALTPDAVATVVPCRSTSTRSTIAATPDGRPRPQPGFSPG